MLKAELNQVAQTANIDLVNIRTIEIDYYVQLFNTFETQCALIAGFQLATISMVPTDEVSRVAANIYWISSALNICLSLHVILCSIYATAFGQGLALRGPPGSMVRAVQGMYAEQYNIVYIFSINVFILGVSVISTYYCVMDEIGAHICCGITVVAMYCWYHYCMRIYNRFTYIEEAPHTEWSGTDRYTTDSHDHRGVDIRKVSQEKGRGERKRDKDKDKDKDRKKKTNSVRKIIVGMFTKRKKKKSFCSDDSTCHLDLDSAGSVDSSSAADFRTNSQSKFSSNSPLSINTQQSSHFSSEFVSGPYDRGSDSSGTSYGSNSPMLV